MDPSDLLHGSWHLHDHERRSPGVLSVRKQLNGEHNDASIWANLSDEDLRLHVYV